MTQRQPHLQRSLAERYPVQCAVLAALHLAFVALFIWTDFSEGDDSPGLRALRSYKSASGIFRDYRFFAPAVASDMRAAFVLRKADGASELVPLAADNLEVGFRYNCIIGASMRNERVRDLMAQSWAAAMLGLHPEVPRLTVVAQAYDLPAMADYAAGERPRWQTVYGGTFDHKRRVDAPPLSLPGASAAKRMR